MRRPARWKVLPDAAALLGAAYAWRALDAVSGSGVTQSLAPYIGAVTLTKDGTGQPVKAASATLPNAATISFDGATATGGYSAALAISASFTVVHVLRATKTAQNGFHAMTVGGVVSTGNASGYVSAANVYGIKVITPAAKAVALPANVIVLAEYTAAGVSIYANALTPVTVSAAGALVGNTFTIGNLAPAGTWVFGGEWERTAVWTRALTTDEKAYLFSAEGRRCRIAIAP